jgi:hypothetical protein
MAAVQKSSAEQSPAPPRLGDRLLHWIKRLPPQTRLMALSMVVGVIAGLGAILF